MILSVPIIFTIVAIVFFAFALHISQYKKRKSGCCGGADIVAVVDQWVTDRFPHLGMGGKMHNRIDPVGGKKLIKKI